MWEKQLSYFADYHCLVPALVENEPPFSIDNAAEQIIELIERKAADKEIIVIGFSLGAQTAVSILGKRPDLIDCAMINSALVRPIPFSRTLQLIMKLSLPLLKNRTFSRIQAKSMYIDPDHFHTYYEESLQLSKETYMNMLKENMACRIPDFFPEARGRILVTAGGKEKKMMKQSVRALVESSPNCTGCVIPHIGHGFPMADPALFNETAQSWIRYGKVPEHAGILYEPDLINRRQAK